MRIADTAYRPRSADVPWTEQEVGLNNGISPIERTEATDSFFCEFGGNLYAVTVFPLGDEVGMVTLLLGPVEAFDGEVIDLSATPAYLRGGAKDKRPEKETEIREPAAEQPAPTPPVDERPRPKPGPSPRPAGRVGTGRDGASQARSFVVYKQTLIKDK